MDALKDLLGENLKNSQGENVNTETLYGADKVIGLYFSAHWCPPCRAFTPHLVEFYKGFKQSDKCSTFEVVFISSDRDDSSFQEYFREMPWLSLPFEDRDRKARLSKKFKVEGIPMFILLDAETCAVITKKGRDNVMADPTATDFPWFPKSLREQMAGPLITTSGTTLSQDATQGKIIGLYFSAHWCPPCRSFTPKLVDTYNKVKNNGNNFEIIFVSADRTKESFDEYFSTMQWLSLPYGDQRNKSLPTEFEVDGIPCLVLLDENYKVITSNGRGYIESDPEGKEFPWHPKPVEKLTDMVASNVNEMACMILFTRGNDEWVDQAESLLMEAAVIHKSLLEKDATIEPLCFMYEVKECDEVADSIMEFTQLEERYPQLVVVDIPEQKKYSHPAGELTKDVVMQVAANFRSGSLPLKSLHE